MKQRSYLDFFLVFSTYGLLLILGSTLSSCQPYKALEQLKKDIFFHFPSQEYGPATGVSHTLIFYEPAELKEKMVQVETLQGQLASIKPTEKWKPEKKILLEELRNYLQMLESHFRQFQTDPSRYNLGGLLAQILHNASLSQSQKSHLCLQNLQQASRYYRTAQGCIANPEPERLQLGIDKQLFTIQFMEETLRDSIRQWTLPDHQAKAFNKELYIANLACKDYVAFCNSLLFEKREAGLFSKD